MRMQIRFIDRHPPASLKSAETRTTIATPTPNSTMLWFAHWTKIQVLILTVILNSTTTATEIGNTSSTGIGTPSARAILVAVA